MPEVEIAGRRLSLTNLDKVLYPEAGFTKAQVIDYYARIAPWMLPHLEGRALTLVRCPNGVEGERFFEKRCPPHHPDWIPEVGELHLYQRTPPWIVPRNDFAFSDEHKAKLRSSKLRQRIERASGDCK